MFGFAGWSGSGKTTLIEALVPRLTERGWRVSLVKHAHHGFDVDQPGKDSHRHRMAGCAEVLVTSAARWALVHELRGVELYKVPGVSETLDWVAALAALNHHALDVDAIESTLGVVLKAKDDIETVRGERLAGMLQRALSR